MRPEAWETPAPPGRSWTSPCGLAEVGKGWSLSVGLPRRPAPRPEHFSACHCAVPVVMGLLAFCNGPGVGRLRTHASCGDWALPVFSGAGLATVDVETGAAAAWVAPGWAPRLCPEEPKRARHPEPQAGLGGLSYPPPQASVFPTPTASAKRKESGRAVTQG